MAFAQRRQHRRGQCLRGGGVGGPGHHAGIAIRRVGIGEAAEQRDVATRMGGFQAARHRQQRRHRRLVAAHAKARQQGAELGDAAVQPLSAAQRIQPRQRARGSRAQVHVRIGPVGAAEVQQAGPGRVGIGMQVEAGEQWPVAQQRAHALQQRSLRRLVTRRDGRAVQRQVQRVGPAALQVGQQFVAEGGEQRVVDRSAGPGCSAARYLHVPIGARRGEVGHRGQLVFAAAHRRQRGLAACPLDTLEIGQGGAGGCEAVALEPQPRHQQPARPHGRSVSRPAGCALAELTPELPHST